MVLQNVYCSIKDEESENFKEKFSDWLIGKDGSSINYYSKDFSSNRDKLIENLDRYNSLYSKDYDSDLFDFKTSEIKNKIEEIRTNIYKKSGFFYDYSAKTSHHMPRAILGKENYLTFLDEQVVNLNQSPLDIEKFKTQCELAGLIYSNSLITRYISSLATKPFVLLSGLSGSGKTKLAQAYAQWICKSKEQYCIVPVGADWTNREPLLGYVNALNNKEYILPENGALELIIRANEDEKKPFFLILDEMNLSHVERYFADFLSVMESSDGIKLHSGTAKNAPEKLSWPANLFIVGTVNIDETTYMFSPKVLDRANVIEFRIEEEEMSEYLEKPKQVTNLSGEGAGMGENFVEISNKETKTNPAELKEALKSFFIELQKIGSEFGYRTASEIQTLFGKIDLINPDYESEDKIDVKIDIAIMQKLLPKLHGSRRKILTTLTVLAQLCLKEESVNIFNEKGEINIEEEKIKYSLSFYKIARMYKGAIENGFTSYAEA